MANDIVGGGERMNKLTHLIGDLLDDTKIESGQLRLIRKSLDFDQLVKSVASSM